MNLKRLKALIIVLALGLLLAACQNTDVVGKVAVTSFQAVLDKIPGQVTEDEMGDFWVLQSPAGDEFKWSKNLSESMADAEVEFDAAPFINAGLDINQLPANQYAYDESTNRIIMAYELGHGEVKSASGEVTPISSFKQLVETHRDAIGYHEVLDHYGVALGNGNMFEWAKDMSKNDKDIVFVLNPQPLIDAGVDPNTIEGWVFAKVEVKDANGKKELVDKILRPFNLD